MLSIVDLMHSVDNHFRSVFLVATTVAEAFPTMVAVCWNVRRFKAFAKFISCSSVVCLIAPSEWLYWILLIYLLLNVSISVDGKGPVTVLLLVPSVSAGIRLVSVASSAHHCALNSESGCWD